MFDIIFMSYQEPNADENWDKLVSKYKWAQRVHGVKGLVNAHIECAKVSRTSMYYHVEADNIVDENFNFVEFRISPDFKEQWVILIVQFEGGAERHKAAVYLP